MQALRELAVLLGFEADEKAFAKAMLKVKGIESAARAVVDIAKEMARAMVDAVVETAKTGADVLDLSKRTGVATQALQAFQYAAELNGASLQDVGMGMKGLANAMQSASKGTGEQAEAFARLGIRVKGADGKLRPMNDVLFDIADKFEAMPDGAEKSATALDLLGKGGIALIPMLDEGGKKLADLTKKAERFGLIMDTDTIEAADAFDDAMVEVDSALKGLRNTIAGPLLKPLANVMNLFSEWVASHRELLASGLNRFLSIAGKALGVVWRILRPVVDLFAKLAESEALWTALGIAFGAMAISLGVAAAAAGLLAAVLIPFMVLGITMGALFAAALMAIPAAIALIAEDLYIFSKGGRSVFGLLIDGLKQAGLSIGSSLGGWFDGAIETWKQKFTDFKWWIIAAFPGGAGIAALGAGISALTGGDGPKQEAGAGGPGVRVASPRFSANFSIQTTPGQDTVAVGNQVRTSLDEWWSTKMDDVFASVEGG